MNALRSTLAITLLATTLALTSLPAAAKGAGRNPPPTRTPVSEPAPAAMNPLATFWAQWLVYWGN